MEEAVISKDQISNAFRQRKEAAMDEILDGRGHFVEEAPGKGQSPESMHVPQGDRQLPLVGKDGVGRRAPDLHKSVDDIAAASVGKCRSSDGVKEINRGQQLRTDAEDDVCPLEVERSRLNMLINGPRLKKMVFNGVYGEEDRSRKRNGDGKMQGNGGAAPTGCYKCGRPGHWSRDCPISPSNPEGGSKPNPESNTTSNPKPNSSRGPYKPGGPNSTEGAPEKPKRLSSTRPKLTAELLLSNDGLGYVLRHFPGAFKYHGRGHEISDLNNLISLYAQWHKHLIPYYSFGQFLQKVEKLGGTRRVKMCLRELRDRVANGGDPTKLHEAPVENIDPHHEADAEENMDGDLSVPNEDNLLVENLEGDNIQEEMLDEIYMKASEEPSIAISAEAAPQPSPVPEVPSQTLDKGQDASKFSSVTAEQKARMEANRLKALERMKARASQEASVPSA
ncbi:hypothetical protein H6P81_018178 [Aristolochia fimbriata]|uniref:CCHC-type domain-containing protein n=1 Tax=Aristolochia fimbriata TaxID=158543 RepID=A0AAV7E0L6_ARIFI|nr:hypothetical protein H6P81_018178 [Aristolochia fimbriata]